MIALIGLLLGASVLMAEEGASTTPMAPADKWAVEQVAGRCHATRRYGASGEITLRMTAQPLTSTYSLSVDLNRRIDIKYDDPVTVILEPTGKTLTGRASVFLSSNGRPTVIGTLIDKSPFADGNISAISVSANNERLAYLAITSMPQLVAALNKCQDVVLAAFGVDMTTQAAVATLPEPVNKRILSADTYPIAALRAGAEGTVGGRFQVSSTGSVTDCVVALSSGNAALDQRSCAIWLSRGRFKPALDKAGHPIASAQIFSMEWRLPRQ